VTVALIPDAEKLVGAYLREHAAIAALDARVAGAIPSDTKRAWVRVTQLDAARAAGSRPDYLIGYLLQFDCYAGGDAMKAHTGQSEASTLARTVRAVLDAASGETVGTGGERAVITGTRFPSMIRIPDEAFEPARERFVLDTVVHMRPA
jgi:hypothetical protein